MPRYTRLLLGVGLKEFGTRLSTLLGIKKIVRMSSLAKLRTFARKVTHADDPLHPSVLQLTIGVIKTGKAASIPIAKCGEMAGDAALYALVIGSGSQGIWHAPLHTAWDQENRPHE